MKGLPEILKFNPILKPLPWGGRRLESLLNKILPDDKPYGESWEIVDLPSDQSVVNEGSLKGMTLGSIIKKNERELLGNARLLDGHFPLLFKFIDANNTLSVQVHPDEESCKKIGGGARPKTEAWYILHAEPGAKLYLGLKRGVTKKSFEESLRSGTVADLLEERKVKLGDFIFIPAGLIHAIGKGIVLAEIQQSSATTYRVFDWNRVGLDGKPRELHIDEALLSINFDQSDSMSSSKPVSEREGVSCKYFSFEKVLLNSGEGAHFRGGSPRIISCINGEGVLNIDSFPQSPLTKGESFLIPAIQNADLETRSGGVFLLISCNY